MKRIYLYKTANKSVSYDNEHWYVDDAPQPQKDGEGLDNFKEYATAQAYDIMSHDITKYVNHFHNIAVLTAAGTSMENGKHGGKTRTELWDSYKNEIKEISSVFMHKDGTLKDRCQAIIESQNIEDFLSFVILYEKLNGAIKDNNGNLLTMIALMK